MVEKSAEKDREGREGQKGLQDTPGENKGQGKREDKSGRDIKIKDTGSRRYNKKKKLSQTRKTLQQTKEQHNI